MSCTEIAYKLRVFTGPDLMFCPYNLINIQIVTISLKKKTATIIVLIVGIYVSFNCSPNDYFIINTFKINLNCRPYFYPSEDVYLHRHIECLVSSACAYA